MVPKMKLSFGVTSGMTLNWILNLNAMAEKEGAYGLWIGEDMDRGNNIFTSTALCLMETSTVKVGIDITTPLIRNISTIARATASLAELGGNRFRLGLGIGGLQDLTKRNIAVKKPFSIISEAVSLLRKILSGETVSSTGMFQLNQYSFPFNVNVPIYIGARGENMLKTAGKIADGVIISGPVEYVEKAISFVNEGRKTRMQICDDFQTVVWLPSVLTHSKDEMKLAKETVAVVIGDTPQKSFRISRC